MHHRLIPSGSSDEQAQLLSDLKTMVFCFFFVFVLCQFAYKKKREEDSFCLFVHSVDFLLSWSNSDNFLENITSYFSSNSIRFVEC